jgi:hypothetical protein
MFGTWITVNLRDMPQRCLDSALDCWEIRRIPVIDAVGIAYGNANLADAAQSLLNQSFVPLMERLVAAQEERRWRLRNKLVQELFTNLLHPKGWSALAINPHVKVRRHLEHVVRQIGLS